MIKIDISGEQSNSTILVGEQCSSFSKYLPDKPVFVITDEKVKHLYGQHFSQFPTFCIGQGEEIKTLETVSQIVAFLLENGAGRDAFLLAIGGGIVCDVAGFVASIFMRGVEFGFVSTTLLSQVDASVGGKNGVNLLGYKNMLGVFNQPRFVICDPNMLHTLGTHEIADGFAEIVKHTLICDAEMFGWLEQNHESARMLKAESINLLVENSVNIKAGIVNADEKETGERRKLNLGHTVGHAIEKVHKLSHGHAVSLGLAVAAKLSVMKGYLSTMDEQRLLNLLLKLGLPVEIPPMSDEIIAASMADKKRESQHVYFIFMHGIGKVRVEKVELEEFAGMLRKL